MQAISAPAAAEGDNAGARSVAASGKQIIPAMKPRPAAVETIRLCRSRVQHSKRRFPGVGPPFEGILIPRPTAVESQFPFGTSPDLEVLLRQVN